MHVLRRVLLTLVLSLLGVSTAHAQSLLPDTKKSLVYSVKGSYTSTFNSHGRILAWYLYSDGTMDGQWKTDRGTIFINTKGELKLQELATAAGSQYYLVFRSSGRVVLPNGLTVPCTLMGKALFGASSLNGDYILLIDNDDINSDFGQLSGEVTQWN